MRFHYVTFPVVSTGDSESISAAFRDAAKPGLDGPEVSIRWVRDGKSDWDMPRVTMTGSPEEVLEAMRVLNALVNFSDRIPTKLRDPDALLTSIGRTHGEQAVFDPATKEHVPTRKIDVTETTWRVMVDGKSILVVKDANEDRARKEAGRRLITLMDEDPAIGALLSQWISERRPLQKVEDANAVAVYPIEAYVTREHAAKAAAAAKAEPVKDVDEVAKEKAKAAHDGKPVAKKGKK